MVNRMVQMHLYFNLAGPLNILYMTVVGTILALQIIAEVDE